MVSIAGSLGIVLLSIFGSGLAGLPISVPPLPPHPIIERAAPDACLVYVSLAGLAVPATDSKNLTERMLAGEEIQEFLAAFAAQARWIAVSASPERQRALAETVIAVAEVLLTRPLALAVEQFTPPTPQGPPTIVASVVIHAGDRIDSLELAMNSLADIVLADAPAELRPVSIPGSTCRQVATPVGPLSWGPLVSAELKGTYVMTLGPDAFQSLMARLGKGKRSVPAWKGDLEKRIPVARRSTLTYVDARAVMQTVRELPAPDQDKVEAFLDASGLSGLVTLGAVSGMTTEGVSGALWLGFDGTPTGLFAAPASGIGTKQLRRIPSDAIMAQTWSLDLSAMLATVLDIVSAVEPQAAAEFRENLAQFRAAAGFDIDTQVLKTLGPDWTLFATQSPGGMLPGIGIIAGVRDRDLLATIHKVLLTRLRAATANGDVQLAVREIPYRKQTLFCLEIATDEFVFPIEPTWCLTDDSLIVTISPQFMKTQLACDPEDDGLGGLPEVQQAVHAGEPSFVATVDSAWSVGSFCSLYEVVSPFVRGLLRKEGIEIDLPQLPALSAVSPFLRTNVTVIRHEGDGILMETTGTIPLVGGGGMVVSPSSSAPVLLSLLLPAVQSAREAANRAAMMNNFRQVTIAMLLSTEASGRLPSQAICDDEGKPLLSWRVAMLPYLGEDELFKEFRLDEPWDSEHNQKLVGRMPSVFSSPDAKAEDTRNGLTTVQLITGSGTVFATPSEGLSIDEVQDGTSHTVALVEALPERAVPWAKPADIAFDPEQPVAGVGNPRRQGGLFIVGFLDGHVQTLTADIPADTFKAIVTPSGGEAVELP